MNFPNDLKSFCNDWVYEPLEIILEIGTPMVLVHPFVSFDSLVLNLYAKSFYRENFALLPTNVILREDLFPKELKIPILNHHSGMYHASVSIFDEDITSLARMHYIRRRFEDKYLKFMKPVKKIGINKGTLKNYEMKIIQVSPARVRFYCVGVKGILEELLKDLRGLGKKINTGNGVILSFEIKPILEDHSFSMNGIANKPIPVRFLKSTSRQAPMTWLPPYWARDKIEVCAPPGAKIEFIDEWEEWNHES